MIPVLFRVPDWVPLVGDQAITSFGSLLLVAFLVAGWLFVRGLRLQHPDAVGWDLVVTGAVAGLLGAKLLHLSVHTVLGLPGGALGRGGLAWFGGLAAGTGAVLWHARRQGLRPAAVAGAAAAPLALGYAVGRIGSFLVGAEYGHPTALPWGMAFPAGVPPTTPANLMAEFGVIVPPGARTGALGDFVRVHPTQLYETALSLMVFGVLRREERRNESRMAGWRLFGLFLLLGGVSRSLVELIRVKRDVVAGPITVDFLLALAVVAVGAALWLRARRPPGQRIRGKQSAQASEVA